jgi:hypothetical protein
VQPKNGLCFRSVDGSNDCEVNYRKGAEDTDENSMKLYQYVIQTIAFCVACVGIAIYLGVRLLCGLGIEED